MFPPVFWLALFESSILVTDLSIRKERGAQGYFINIKNNYNFCLFTSRLTFLLVAQNLFRIRYSHIMLCTDIEINLYVRNIIQILLSSFRCLNLTDPNQ